MRKFNSLVLGMILFSSHSFAARYLVTYKEDRAFTKAHNEFVLFLKQPGDVQVEDSLTAVQALVVESADEAGIQAFARNKNVVVEKEMFHPAPAPIEGFEPSSAWSYDIRYAVQGPFKKAPVLKGQDVQLRQVGGTPWGVDTVHAKDAWALSQKGLGVRVLVLDSGIDKNQPALRNRIEATKDFVGDAQSPYDVFDKVGHGTHVSGTVLAEESADGFTGVAPAAKLLMGRVCSGEGCSTIGVVQGINWGIQQKVDVINMSLGGPFASQAERDALEKADAAGITVVAASGNGGNPSVGYPAAFPTVIAVGAIDQKLMKATFSQWGPELDVMAPGVEVYSSVPMGSGCQSSVQVAGSTPSSTCFSGSAFVKNTTKTLVAAGLGKPADFAGKNFAGKFALVQRGEITFHDKVINALGANAAGVVIYNNVAGVSGGSLTEDGSLLAVPVAMIDQTTGEKIRIDLATGKSVSLSLATEPADFAAFSGTSMASPHVAGIVALMKATKKSLTPAQVRKILNETSVLGSGTNNQNQMGKGLVNALSAVKKAAL